MKQKYQEDIILLITIILLLAIGLLFLYSTSEYNGRVKFDDSAYYLKKQLAASVLGIIAMFLVSHLDYHWIAEKSLWLYLLAIALSTAVLFVGQEYNGSKRWLALGPLSFQPSEFTKISVVVVLAYFISKTKRSLNKIGFMIISMLLILPLVGLVGTNNLSTAIIILGIGMVMIFVSYPGYLPFVWMGGIGVGVIVLFLSLESYRLERLAVWRDPEAYDKGFQTIQGLYAIGSGGIFGKGLGNSLQKMGFVPEAQNDMIFSIICEETGLCGAILVLILFGFLIWRILVHAMHAPDLLGCLICSGVLSHMAIQVILNVAVVTNTIPNTGITLPFISYGGTSVLFLLSELGLVLSVSRFHYGE